VKQARANVKAALKDSECPAVLCCFGKDSLLLLALAREVAPDIRCVWFRVGFPEKFARSVIAEWNLEVYSYPPADSYLLSDGSRIALINEYAFATDHMPLATDLAPGTTCILHRPTITLSAVYQPWDVLLSGYKDTDTHWIKGDSKLFREEGVMLGNARVFAPIRHMTDDEVRAASLELGLPVAPADDELAVCSRCMEHGDGEVWCPEEGKHIPREQWDRDTALSNFRGRFGLEVHDG
jgi:3'-phosphoadenosine 5'-phosphosulfate sulfotransferase (PAPS reductase)/FAD synthetase